ncbi:MAG: hypothetical protein ACRCXA_11810 [Peptostreptococcaceae bacterium]
MCSDKISNDSNEDSKYNNSKLCKEYKECECCECQFICQNSPWFIVEKNNRKNIESTIEDKLR